VPVNIAEIKVILFEILDGFLEKNKLFYNEGHLQLVLAEHLAGIYPDANVYLEESFGSKSIDIVIKNSSNKALYAIELKYCFKMTDDLKKLVNDYNLKGNTVKFDAEKPGSGGQTSRRYSFWKDVEKLQEYQHDPNGGCSGCAIFFTNDRTYWEKVGPTYASVNFSMHERTVPPGALEWNSNAEHSGVNLIKDYPVNWKPALKSESEFRYLMLFVTP